jgi:hypothetical protein
MRKGSVKEGCHLRREEEDVTHVLLKCSETWKWRENVQ